MAVSAEERLGVSSEIRDTEWVEEQSRRSPWWVEILVVVWLCWFYDEINNHAPLRMHTALVHAQSILHLENLLHLNPELSLNAWAAAHTGIALPMADFYDTAHFVITLGLAALLWWRFPKLYRPLRNTLVLINVVGFLVFWAYPLAPPRMLPTAGFVDVVAVTHAWGSWRTSPVASQANELAAMPSLHIAWACWSSLAVWRILPGRRWRAVVWIYPVMTALIVMATGNHFLMDVFGGLATIVVAYAIAKILSALMIVPRARARLLAMRRRGPTATDAMRTGLAFPELPNRKWWPTPSSALPVRHRSSRPLRHDAEHEPESGAPPAPRSATQDP